MPKKTIVFSDYFLDISVITYVCRQIIALESLIKKRKFLFPY